MGFCQSLSRTGLLIFNSLFALGGLAILIAGSVFYAKGETYGISAPTAIGTRDARSRVRARARAAIRPAKSPRKKVDSNGTQTCVALS